MEKIAVLFEPKEGFEPTTCCLQNSCSTTELLRRRNQYTLLRFVVQALDILRRKSLTIDTNIINGSIELTSGIFRPNVRDSTAIATARG